MNVMRAYPHYCTEREIKAVDDALKETEKMIDGDDRKKFIHMIFFKKSHTIAGAAMNIPISERTAQRWHSDFIRLVGYYLKLDE